MKQNNLLLLGITSLALAAGCKKEEATPLDSIVTACATLNMDSATTEETIVFTNCSKNAATYSWDFGDGTSSTSPSPSHKYVANGTYTVKQKAISPNGNRTSEATHTVVIGDRYIKAFRINLVSFQNPSGANWDVDGTGPDVFISFYPTANTAAVKGSTVKDNLTPAMLPHTFGGYDEKATNEEWALHIGDSDSPTPEIMYTFTFNARTGSPKLTAPGYNVDVVYEIRP